MDAPTRRILVIDDDRVSRDTVAEVLTDEGYRVETAENGRAGLAVFQSFRPDLVITDLQMPELDGLGVLARVREMQAELPVMIVTASPSRDAREQAERLRVTDYLSKPVELDVVLDRIARNLRASR